MLRSKNKRVNNLVLLLCGLALCSALACSDDTTAADSGGGDARADLTSPDLTASDRGPQADAPARDVVPHEQGSTDTGTDAAPALGCAKPATGTMAGTDVVACVGPTAGVSQCAAAAYCDTGWALCTASQYQTRYGSASPPPVAVTDGLWLAGCVRDGALPMAPADGVCSSCAADLGANKDVGWSCVNSVTTNTDRLYVGLRTGSACTHAGTSAAMTKGFWAAWPSMSTLSGALCCWQ